MHRVKILSLGCAKNLVDSEVMTGMLQEAGYVLCRDTEDANVLIVNTCGFIADAREESVNTILEAAGYKNGGNCRALIVTGCLAQKYKDEILREIPEIDGLIGTGEIPRIAEAVTAAINGDRPAYIKTPTFIYSHEMPRILQTPAYSAYVKIAEGCSNRCTYCAIPEIRGEFRSRKTESILSEAVGLVKTGVREINLIAQDTTRYGLDIYGHHRLDELLQDLAAVQGLAWIRVLYAYPTHFTDRLIEVMAGNDKICRYLDIPLQHADDQILRAMNRRGKTRDILELIEKLRQRIPGLVLRTSFIVGFPGETEEAFQRLVDFVKTVRFDKVGVFTYSPEEGTPAVKMGGQIPDELKEERKDRLMEVQQVISLAINRDKIGRTVQAIIEREDETGQGRYIGRTQTDAPEVDGNIFVQGTALYPGQIVPVKVTHAYEYDLIGEVAQ